MTRFKLPFILVSTVLVVILAWALRARAVQLLPVDYDEDDYMRAAQQYTALIRQGNWADFTQTNYRAEHPPLAKIVFGFSLLQAPPAPLIPDRPTTAGPDQYLPRKQLYAARSIGAVLGTVTVGLLALVNPLAGLLLSIHAMTIKYVSQVMLEALPAFTSLAMVLAYLQSKKQKNKTAWLALSAVFLGLTAASKYLYCVAGIAILVDWFLDFRQDKKTAPPVWTMLLWGLAAVLVFFAADPYLWPDPVGRLKDSILYHANYSTGAAEVQESNFPTWQPLVWLSISPYSWHEGVFVFGIDGLISLFGLLGLTRLWKKSRIYVLWLAIGIVFLLLWPTKWPQYILVLTAPLSLSAAEGLWGVVLAPLWEWVANLRSSFSQPKPASQLRQALPWLIPGLIAFAIFTILPLLFQFGVSMTDFNSQSIRDGLNGGILREVWSGLTGQAAYVNPNFPYHGKEVHFIGLNSFAPTFDIITNQGILLYNLMWTILAVSLQTALGFGAALLLWNRGIRFRRGWEMLFILPWAIPEMIGAVMWFNVFADTSGWLSLAVQEFGKGIPFANLLGWENNASTQLVVMLIAATWYGFPFMMLATSAALKMLPEEVYDAAQLDGASRWQILWNITWPLAMPLVLPAVIIRGIFSFNQFYLFQAFWAGDRSLAALSYNLFNPSGFGDFNGQYSISAVLNIIAMLVLIGFVILFNRWSKAGQGVTYA